MTSPVVYLAGQRLYLRPIEETDLPACQRWINDPQNRRFLLSVMPFDGKAERSWWEGLDRSSPPRSVLLAIVLRDGDRHIGTTGIVSIDWLNRSTETGTLIGEPDCWGQGYGTEAKELLLEYGFDTLGLHRIHSRTFEFNERSARHLRRAGFREEGRQRDAVFRDGRFHDVILYGVLAAEWRARRSPPKAP